MKTKLIIAFIGNIIDIVSTLILMRYYEFIEINPVMAWLLQWPVLAAACKIIAVTGILLFIYYTKRDKYTDLMANIAAMIYGGLGLYYIIIFIILIFI